MKKQFARQWRRSARPSGRARIETNRYVHYKEPHMGSARPSGRARIETQTATSRSQMIVVAPALRGGRGLKLRVYSSKYIRSE